SSALRHHPYHPYLHSFPTRRSSDLGFTTGPRAEFRARAVAPRPANAHIVQFRWTHERCRKPSNTDVSVSSSSTRSSAREPWAPRSEEHTSELQSRVDLVCRLLLEKK